MKRPRVKKNIGYYLRVWRAVHNLSQLEAARFFEISPSHWSFLEQGRRRPSPELAERLWKETGTPLLVSLLGREA